MMRTTVVDRLKNGAFPLAVCLLMPSMTTAQIDRTKAPAPGAPPRVNIGAHKSRLLSNGMRLIVVENHKLPLVSVQVHFDIEPFTQGDKSGYIELTGDLLASGTAQHSKEEIDRMVDGLGATLNPSSEGIYGRCLTKNFPALFALVQEVITGPTFPEEEVEKARKHMLSGLKRRADDPDAIADQVGRALTFSKGHPYGEIITEASVDRVSRDQIVAYYRRFFRPTNGYLVLVGDITMAAAEKLADQGLSQWQGTQVEAKAGADGVEVVEGLGAIHRLRGPKKPQGLRRVAMVDKPGAAQSVIRVMWPLELKPGDRRAMSAQVLNTILGGGVFNARLMQNLREDKGYTYGIHSELASDRYNGHFTASTSVRTAVTDSAITQIMGEIENIQLNKVTADELALAKSYMAGSFARSLEDPRTIARFALNTYLDSLPADHYSTWLERLDAVTIEDVKAAANDLIAPDHAMILVVGDRATVANQIVGQAFDRAVEIYDINADPWMEKAAPAPAGVTVQSVIDAYLNACGGRSKIAAIKDLRIEKTSSMQGTPVTVTEWYTAPNKYATAMKSGTIVLEKTVFDGARAVSDGPMGRRELGDMDLEYVSQNAYPVPEINYNNPHLGLHLDGVMEIDGRPAYKISGTLEAGGMFQEYYDVETGLKVRRVEPRALEQGNLEVTTNYKEYRPEGGIQFPHLVELNMGVPLVFTVTEVVVNKGVPAEVFEVE